MLFACKSQSIDLQALSGENGKKQQANVASTKPTELIKNYAKKKRNKMGGRQKVKGLKTSIGIF